MFVPLFIFLCYKRCFTQNEASLIVILHKKNMFHHIYVKYLCILWSNYLWIICECKMKNEIMVWCKFRMFSSDVWCLQTVINAGTRITCNKLCFIQHWYQSIITTTPHSGIIPHTAEQLIQVVLSLRYIAMYLKLKTTCMHNCNLTI